MSFAARVRAQEDAEDAAWWAANAHAFVPCVNPWCDKVECRHEYAPGQVCGRPKDDPRHSTEKA